ncbi:MAG TPA: protein-export chaperone SecB [Verrucomicrobiae bacterium]|jgi:preprotein translocase subunit SecB
MQLSSLILKGYIITNLSIKAQVPESMEQAAKAIASSTANLTTKVGLAKNDQNQRQWKVSLQVISEATDSSEFCPYRIDIELLGIFEVASNVEESKIQELVSVNAPSLLFGAARELVLLITGRGPLPPVTLPCAVFTDTLKNSKETKKKSNVAHLVRG